jgi:chemotaxis protein histidine kinase CheA
MARQQPNELFMPPNMLKAKMGGSAAGLDLNAIQRAEQAMEDLKSEFADWMNADVARLGQCRDAYAAGPGDKTQSDLYRASHDLKGQALTFECPFAARLAASLCNLLDSHAQVPLKLVNAHIDAIRVTVARNIRDADHPVSAALAEELEAQVREVEKQSRQKK